MARSFGIASFLCQLCALLCLHAAGNRLNRTAISVLEGAVIGLTVGHYSIVEKLGEGGMGVVYKARDLRLDRFVALKLLHGDKTGDEDRRSRFIQEARTASALNHPNIVTIHDIVDHEAQTVIVMELVEGRPLNELIPRKGMQTTQALRIAAQVADALAAAHAADIVHRDLKPANIMVDANGRVKVLDFGLAKLSARASVASADGATRTMTVAQPRTEEGVVLGSVPYMSPEQAEGKPVDERTDIFSFGAVLYEIVTGQRAFRGESRASTLAAVVENEPPPVSALAPATPPELERLIARCLRKDTNRRTQHMADLKLALEELRDESESGRLLRSTMPLSAYSSRRGWPWLVAAVVGVALLAIATLAWMYLSGRGGAAVQEHELTRLSPDDGYSYAAPHISLDGKFVAYVSDRGGSRQAWLQHIAGGDPVQLTRSADPVLGVSFFPDGARLAYATTGSAGRRTTFGVIPILGGEPLILYSAEDVRFAAISPDGRQFAYLERLASALPGDYRLMVGSTQDARPKELSNWRRTQPAQPSVYPFAWTTDSRYVLCVGSKTGNAPIRDDWEWFAVPVDGGDPRPTGAGDVLRKAGLQLAFPAVAAGDRVLFAGGKRDRTNVWEVRLRPDSWSVRGSPRQLTSGTESQFPTSVSASGTSTVQILKASMDVYMAPLAPSGQPTGPTRRLTRDTRYKSLMGVGGERGSAYFTVGNTGMVSGTWDWYALDLESGRQSVLSAGLPSVGNVAVSLDGREVAYSILDGDSYSIWIGPAGGSLGGARRVCRRCGWARRFSADGRLLFLQPEAAPRVERQRKLTLRLLDISTGESRPWLEHPTDSITSISTFGEDAAWFNVHVGPVGTRDSRRSYLVPWTGRSVPPEQWIEVKVPGTDYRTAPHGNFFLFFDGPRLMCVRFDAKTRGFSQPSEVKRFGDGTEWPKPDDQWFIRGPGLVFSRSEMSASVWLLKAPA